MSQSLAQVYLHVVFSTKNRAPWLQSKPLREEMHAYLGGTCRNMDSPALIVGGVQDHVHVLCRLARVYSIADLVRDLKRESSKWIKTKGVDFVDFHWQDGYGAFSISPAHVAVVSRYIADQERHHQTLSFQDEMRRIFRKYEIEYDERYVWD